MESSQPPQQTSAPAASAAPKEPGATSGAVSSESAPAPRSTPAASHSAADLSPAAQLPTTPLTDPHAFVTPAAASAGAAQQGVQQVAAHSGVEGAAEAAQSGVKSNGEAEAQQQDGSRAQSNDGSSGSGLRRSSRSSLGTMPSDASNPYARNYSGSMTQQKKRRKRNGKRGRPPKVEPTEDLTLPICLNMTRTYLEDPQASAFHAPVDTSMFPSYRSVVKHPMDLRTLNDKVERAIAAGEAGDAGYTPDDFVRDMRLIWNNCKLFNRKNTPIWKCADKYSDHFEEVLLPYRHNAGRHRSSVTTTTRSGRRTTKRASYVDDAWELEEAMLLREQKKAREADRANATHPNLDKILAHRMVQRANGVEEMEFLVKWEGMSYLHVEWVQRDAILRSRQKLRRYEKAAEKRREEGIEEADEPFDPRYTQVERIIDYVVDEQNDPWYMVKWEELGYSECTWEHPDTLQADDAIAQYKRWATPPTKPPPPRPAPTEHENLAEGLQYKNDNKLRSYQLEGLNWLAYNWHHRRGSILADEMGLGKTIQSVSFLHYLKEVQQIPGPFLIACNLSTLEHWDREIREWTNLNSIKYYGPRRDRIVIREHEFYYRNAKGKVICPGAYKFDVLLTTYDMLTASDWAELGAVRWACIIVDEAQRMKSHVSKFRQNLCTFRSDHRVLLTGTPIQNNTTELWALLNYVAPQHFDSMEDFQAKFGTLETSEQVAELHELLSPFLLRRMKEDVEKSIPAKQETIVEVELTHLQKKYYRAVLDRNRGFLSKGCSGSNVPHLLNVAMQLRKVCNHPYLLKGVEDKEVALLEDEQRDYLKALIDSSGKLVLLDKLLPKLRAEGHRVLVFSQMVKVLDLLETYLSFRRWKFERIDGSIRGNERQAAIDRFSEPDSDIFVFLLCTRAGGVGINLTAADTVVIFDSDWNPQNDVQAQARCHRIGQQNEVSVYRLLTRNTYEREMFERASKKLGLDQAVLHSVRSDMTGTEPDGKDVEELLRYGAYDLFREGEEEVVRSFMEADIEDILAGNAKTITYNRKGNAGGDGSTFSKAVFQANSADSNVDMHADNFWDLVLGQAKTADFLWTQLKEGVPLESQEAKDEFMTDLKALVDEAKAAWESGRAGDLPADLHILARVLSVIQETEGFSVEEMSNASQWYSMVVTPSRRRGGGDDDEYTSSRRSMGSRGRSSASLLSRGKSKGGKANGSKRSSSGAQGVGPPQKWTRYERSRLQKLLMNFAAPRWADIKEAGDLSKRSVLEVREYSLDLVRQCIRYATDEEAKGVFQRFMGVLDAEAAVQVSPDEIEASLQEARYIDFIKSKVKGWSRRIDLCRRVLRHLELERSQGREGEQLFVPAFPKLIARWWNVMADRHLLLGVAKYGLSATAINEILADESFMFAQKVATFKKEEEQQQAAEAADRAKQQEGAATVAAGNGEPPLKRKKKQSRKDGVLRVELQVEGETCEAAASIQQFTTPKEGVLWELRIPTTMIIQKRVKYIMDGIDNFGREDIVKRRKARSKKDRKSVREAAKRSPAWSEGEKERFVRGLLCYGAGAWVQIIAHAALEKSPSQVEAYYAELMERCKQIRGPVEVSGQTGLFGFVASKAEDSDGEDEVEEGDGVQPMEVEEEDDNNNNNNGIIENDHANGVNEEGEEEEQSAATTEVLGLDVSQWKVSSGQSFQLTRVLAEKMLSKVALLESLRNEILTHPKLLSRIMRATRFQMPSWWSPGHHDWLFLQCVDRYGLGGPEWNDVLMDAASPFHRVTIGTSSSRPTQLQVLRFFRRWLTRMDGGVRRVEYLRALILNPILVKETDRRFYRGRSMAALDVSFLPAIPVVTTLI